MNKCFTSITYLHCSGLLLGRYVCFVFSRAATRLLIPFWMLPGMIPGYKAVIAIELSLSCNLFLCSWAAPRLHFLLIPQTALSI